MSASPDIFEAETIKALRAPAARRQMSVDALIRMLVERVAQDDLFEAVLDDADGAPPVAYSRLSSLEQLVRAKEDRIAELETLLGLLNGFEPPAEWVLTRREAQVMALLVARERVTKDALFTAIYGGDSDVEPVTIESHVSKLRTKLRRFGVEIMSERHLGYRLIDRHRFRQVRA